nr:phytanoyl-CoA dioxygenase family protein [Saprospiraceae bacterium]
MQDLLHQLGVREDTLSPEEKKFLDENGYLNLGQLLTPLQIDQIRSRIDELLQAEGEQAGAELAASKHIRFPKEAGSDRLADLVNKGPVFDLFYTHPRVLAGVAHVLGQHLKLSSLNYRAAKPGMGLQRMHADWHEVVQPRDYKVCNSIWLLDDFSKANGATRLVPGTHLHAQLPQDVMTNPMEPHPQEIVIEAPAGSVFIFNSHTWHGGTTN